jgi:flagellar biosynthesis GTPase FlhF
MRIREFTVPEAVVLEYRRLVESLDEDLLVEFAREHPAMASGFRLNRAAAPRIRKLIMQEVTAGHKAPDALLELLQGVDEVSWGLEPLEAEVVASVADAMAAVIGPERFAAAALMDPREIVHEVGVVIAQNPDAYREVTEDHRETIRSLLLDVTHPFVGLMRSEIELEKGGGPELDGPGSAEAGPTEMEDPGDEAFRTALLDSIRELEEENAALRTELSDRGVKARQLKAVEDKLRQVQEQHAALEKERDGVRRQADETRARVERSERERDVARAELERLQAQFAEDVERRAAEKQRAELHAWVGEAAAAEAAAQSPAAAGDLLLRVASALTRQREQDRHSGNVAQVRQRLDRLRKALGEVRDAAAQAVRPLPELAALEQELDREIRPLVPIVESQPARPSPVATALAARINAAPDGEIEEVGALLNGMADAEFLSSAEADALYRLYHRRLDVLYLAAGPKVLAAASEPDPFWRMQRAFGGGERMALLIDGHNVLFLLDELFGNVYEDGQPRTRARQRLADLTVRLTGGHPECETTLFFDGPQEAHSAAAPNVKIVYSGGQGDNRADDAIIRQLKYYRTEPRPRPRVVVTDDMELRRRVRDTGAAVMPVRQLGALLADVVRESAPPRAASPGGGRSC